MKRSTKFLIFVLGLGLLYSFIRMFGGHGGSGLYDFFDAIAISSIILFVSSVVVLLMNLARLKNHFDTLIFLLISLPLTITTIIGFINYKHYNRIPDLRAKYVRPVSQDQYLKDSTLITIQIDSLISLKNRETHGPKILYTIIDTIMYSQRGDQIFVVYAAKYEPNDWGNKLDPWYLSADRKDSLYWCLEQGPPNAATMTGSYDDIQALKKAVRRYYFNNYCFLESDSLKKNYFWKKRKK